MQPRALGALVEWDPEQRTATVTQGEDVIEITIGSAFLMKNGEYFETMDSLPVIITTEAAWEEPCCRYPDWQGYWK